MGLGMGRIFHLLYPVAGRKQNQLPTGYLSGYHGVLDILYLAWHGWVSGQFYKQSVPTCNHTVSAVEAAHSFIEATVLKLDSNPAKNALNIYVHIYYPGLRLLIFINN